MYKRQDKDHSAVIQAGSMQWIGGNVQATSGVKGIGDFLGKDVYKRQL